MNTNATKNETLHIRINKNLKQEAEYILQNMGLSTSDAVNLFLKQVINTNTIPFTIKAKIPNKETLEAMQEVKDMINGKISKNTQTLEEFFEEMGV
ncbi:MAG: type II toxin-antitoxin system RelB/DinJ family antitoxin [Clostridiales bacterium]|jgi:DNA-damage-inducible protein J|nr:type II toxin-antitoxin system RelB/DinJ family antitoxin [Clostridiales bacterium]